MKPPTQNPTPGDPKTDFEAFITLYEAHFGDFPPKAKPEVAQLWVRAIERIPVSRYERLVELLREVRKGHGRPLLGELEAAARRFWAQNREAEEGKRETASRAGPPEDACLYCGGAGCTFYLAARVENRWKITCRTDLGVLASFSVPCWCSEGEQYPCDDRQTLQGWASRFWKELLLPEAATRDLSPAIAAADLMRESAAAEEAKRTPRAPEPPLERPKPPPETDHTSPPPEQGESPRENERAVTKPAGAGPPPEGGALPF